MAVGKHISIFTASCFEWHILFPNNRITGGKQYSAGTSSGTHLFFSFTYFLLLFRHIFWNFFAFLLVFAHKSGAGVAAAAAVYSSSPLPPDIQVLVRPSETPLSPPLLR